MNGALIYLLVGMQVLVCQFLATRWARALPSYVIGDSAMPAPRRSGDVPARIGRGRRVIGVALLLLVVAAATATGLEPGARKLIAFAVSMLSSATFLGGYLHDRRVLAALASSSPAPARRTGTLERRTLSRHYPLAWELVPAAVFLLTLALSAGHIRSRGDLGLLWVPLLQLLVAGAGLLAAVVHARGTNLPQRARATWGNPDAALRLDLRLRQLELRALLAARITIVLLLGAKQTGRLLPAHAAATEIGAWLLVAALLGVFAVYLLRTARLAPAAAEEVADG